VAPTTSRRRTRSDVFGWARFNTSGTSYGSVRTAPCEEEGFVAVMASTTWAMIVDDPPFIFCTSSPMPGTPHLRDSGSRRLRSDIACLRTGRDRNDPSGAYADTIVWRGHGRPRW
jgi:hypothetical protein